MLKIVPGEPAALIEGREKALVVADLHLGFERELSQLGINMPSQTEKLYMRLRNLIAKHGPSRVILLGDVKHGVPAITEQEWTDIPVFFERLLELGVEVDVVPGNHDGNIEVLLPSGIEVAQQHGIILGDAGLFHGHTWPDIKMLGCETLVIGHIHPTITFRDPMGFRITNQVWVKAPCDKNILAKALLQHYKVKFKREDYPERILKEKFSVELRVKNLIIMPSFNDFLSGRAINKASTLRGAIFKDFIGPILRSGGVALERAEIYLLDGTFIGKLDRLSTLD